jgi:protein-tyrosine phosphatase
MCRIAQADGIQVMVGTPHTADGRFSVTALQVRQSVELLNRTLAAHDVRIKVLAGMEAHLVVDLVERLERKQVLTLNHGRYVLLELPFAVVPPGLEQLLDRLFRLDYGVILAHPERNMQVQDRVKWLLELCAERPPWDLLLQISADSVTGDAGPAAFRTAKTLIKRGVAHIIASDAHSANARPPLLSKAVSIIAGWIGEKQAGLMARDIPLAVLNGLGFPPVDALRPVGRFRRLIERLTDR